MLSFVLLLVLPGPTLVGGQLVHAVPDTLPTIVILVLYVYEVL